MLAPPNLIQIQSDSFKWFQDEGLQDLFREITPIQDSTREGLPSDLVHGRTIREIVEAARIGEIKLEPSGGRFALQFVEHHFGAPKHSEEECREKDMNFAAPLHVKTRLIVKETGEVKEQELFLGDVPLMTDRGTFIINGAERVVVSQLVRSPGAYFTLERDQTTGRELCFSKMIPNRGAWLEFEISNKNVVSVKVDRRRKMPVTVLLRALGYSTDDEITALFADVEPEGEQGFIQTTLEKEPHSKTSDEALLDFYRRLRPGEPSILDNAKALLYNLFFNPRRYDLGRVGRYKLNRSLGTQSPAEARYLLPEDIVALLRQMIRV
ncbi:MAG: DNA-directed RNA polymerase subunit beta, partial [Chloroflexi bacterium]|nr:DNA-directed RNA polymerase subunit beta [Chloroflexota bacterium]